MRRFLAALLGLLLLTPLLASADPPPRVLTRRHSLAMPAGIPRLDLLDPINRTLKMRFLPGVSPYNLAPFNSTGAPSNGPKLQSTDRGMAMAFDGVTANQYLGSIFWGANDSPTALTWCILFKADAAAGTAKYTNILNKSYTNGNSADDQFGTFWDRGDGNIASIYVADNGVSYIFIKPSVPPAAGVWNDICGTWSSVSPFPLIEYVNGIQAASANTFAALNTNNVNGLMSFPRTTGGASPWAGKIAQVFIAERTLSPGEILRLHNDPWAGLIFPGDQIDAQARTPSLASIIGGTVMRAPLTHW